MDMNDGVKLSMPCEFLLAYLFSYYTHEMQFLAAFSEYFDLFMYT
jgi:hypothetical protein